MRTHITLCLFTALLVTACASKSFNPVQHYLSKKSLKLPFGDTVQSCRGYGCTNIDTITLTKEEWQKIGSPFTSKAKTPQEERNKIKTAIASFETIIGEKTGTAQDKAGTFNKTGNFQQDCVDESINTTIYLLALKNRGHLEFHEILTPQSRLPFMKWPHQSATIKDLTTGQKLAVDSWFYDNGQPPVIIDFQKWKKGWTPDNEDEQRS